MSSAPFLLPGSKGVPCREGAEFWPLPASNTISTILLLASRLFAESSRVHVESDPGVGVTREFLCGLEVNSCRSQVGCQRVTEAVPAGHLVRDSRSNERPGG